MIGCVQVAEPGDQGRGATQASHRLTQLLQDCRAGQLKPYTTNILDLCIPEKELAKTRSQKFHLYISKVLRDILSGTTRSQKEL
jgi:hypothetical protein